MVFVSTHASENRSEIETVEGDTGMRNIRWLDGVVLTGEDVVFAHCVWTGGDERGLLAETGTHLTHCPSSNMKFASGIALGNDGPSCNNTLDPFTEMKQASTPQKINQLDSTATPAASIFEMATLNGAKAAGFEKLGTLTEGWRADIVGTSTDTTRATPPYDPPSHLVLAARGEDVTFTMVDGDVLMEDGTVTVADADEIRQRANEIADSLDLEAAIVAAQHVKP